MTQFPAPLAPSTKDEIALRARARVSEILMLIDYVAGNSDERLTDLPIALSPSLKPIGSQGQAATQSQAGGQQVSTTLADVLACVAGIETALDAMTLLTSDQRTNLQLIRDALNTEIKPASGLTVAYSSMVVGPYRSETASLKKLADQAYEQLDKTARRHRKLMYVLCAFTVLITGLAVWESSKVALGRALLDNMGLLRNQQVLLTDEIAKTDAVLSAAANALHEPGERPAGATPQVRDFRMCDRALVRIAALSNRTPENEAVLLELGHVRSVMPFGTPEERNLCGRDDVLRANIDLMHANLATFMTDWPTMMGGLFKLGRHLPCWFLGCDAAVASTEADKRDIEFKVAAVLLVWGNLILPIVFGTIGSCISVLLDFWSKLKLHQLHPNDRSFELIRLGMGLVIGACVGLFYSGTNMTPPAAAPVPGPVLLSSLTLTASGVAFLAGFGVEAVFGMLHSLLGRVFPNKPEQVK